MITKPRGDYNGITCVFSKPSRLDTSKLATGRAGQILMDFLQPQYSMLQCEMRTVEESSKLLPDTKGVLLFGQHALSEWVDSYSLSNQRGYPLTLSHKGLICPAIATFAPQECCDLVDYEHATEEDGGKTDDKDRSKTARANYRFWFGRDIAKLKRHVASDARLIEPETFRTFPPIEHVVNHLSSARGQMLYLDIETHPETQLLTCIGYAIDDGPVYCVPIYRYTHNLAYRDTHLILRALALALLRNTVIVHNTCFDLIFLALRYRIPFGQKIIDTMAVTHRCYPEAEKSLSHLVSLWSDFPFHKGDNHGFNPPNLKAEEDLWIYNCRDVHTMRYCLKQMMKHAKRIKGLSESIEQVNASLYPLLVNTLLGVRYDATTRDAELDERVRYIAQLKRIASIIAGYSLNPGSTKQLGDYLFARMRYRPTGRTDTGAPSCAKKDLLKLAQKEDNPIIQLAIAYRSTQAVAGLLKFNPTNLRYNLEYGEYDTLPEPQYSTEMP